MADKPDPAAKADDTPDDDLGDAGKRALDRERAARREAEAKVKELEPLAAKAQQLEEAGKTAEQRFDERLAAVERRAQDSETRAMRLEVAAAKGLTAAQARRLTGDTRAAMEADADDLLEAFTPAKKTDTDDGGDAGDDKPKDTDDDGAKPTGGPAGGRPTEQLRGGTRPTEEPAVDIRKAVAEIPRGF